MLKCTTGIDKLKEIGNSTDLFVTLLEKFDRNDSNIAYFLNEVGVGEKIFDKIFDNEAALSDIDKHPENIEEHFKNKEEYEKVKTELPGYHTELKENILSRADELEKNKISILIPEDHKAFEAIKKDDFQTLNNMVTNGYKPSEGIVKEINKLKISDNKKMA